jgi:hypothetical protein
MIEIITLKQSHNRFLLIDVSELYHIGASLKNLGMKWLAFSRMNDVAPLLLERVKEN